MTVQLLSGTGTLTLSGPSNYTGNIAASAGTVNFGPTAGITATYGGVSGRMYVTVKHR